MRLFHRKFFFLLIAIHSVTGELCAQSSKEKIYETPLWEISGNGLTNPSYIFGSLHTLPDTWLNDYPVILSKLQSSQTYIGERNLFEYLQKNAAGIKNDTPLIKMLRPDQYRFIDSFLKVNYNGSSLSDSDAVSFTIIDLIGVTGEYFAKKSNGNQRQTSNLDATIQQKAMTLKKKMVAFETEVDLNKLYVRGKNITSMVDMFIKILNNIDAPEIQDQYKDITASYLSLKLNYRFSSNSDNETTIDERNANWLSTLIASIKESPCFIHIGLGHLEYKTGLLMLLKEKGYTVTPVPVK